MIAETPPWTGESVKTGLNKVGHSHSYLIFGRGLKRGLHLLLPVLATPSSFEAVRARFMRSNGCPPMLMQCCLSNPFGIPDCTLFQFFSVNGR